MKNITIRLIKEEDYEFINSWWKAIKVKPPSRKFYQKMVYMGLWLVKMTNL